MSFIAVTTCWRYHHILFEKLDDYSRSMLWLSFTWLFTVLAIPILTAAKFDESSDESADAILSVNESLSNENYFVYWFVLAMSFALLLGIAKTAGPGQLRSGQDGYPHSARTFLPPVIICLAAAIGALFAALGGETIVFVLIVVFGVWSIVRNRRRNIA